MIKNYFTVAWRSLTKSKGFTSLNIVGLSFGMAACMLIFLFVKDELSYDKFHAKANRIFRITDKVRLNGTENSYAGSGKPLKDLLETFPDVEQTARIFPASSMFISPKKYYVQKDGQDIEEKAIAYTESSLFNVFSLPFVTGAPAHALDKPFTAVISESAAKKYLNDVNVVGHTLTLNDSVPYKITGVMKDIPTQSHFHYDILLSYSSTPESEANGWGYSGIHNYVLTRDGVNIQKLSDAITLAELKAMPVFAEGNNYLKVQLTPVTEIHLRSVSQYELEKGGNIELVYVFSIVAVFILLIACVNFINLSTARASERAKEVGVRKALGSSKQLLVMQFLTESLLITFISAIISVGLLYLLLPYFNGIASKSLSLRLDAMGWFIPAMLGLILFIGSLAGAYPAFYLSRFTAVKVLKGNHATGVKRSYVRSFLVVTQFAVSIFLIAGTLVIYNQIDFIQKKDVGFNRAQVISIKNLQALGDQAKSFKQEVKNLPGISNATMAAYLPTGEDKHITGLFPSLPIDLKQDVLSEFWPVDEDYVPTLGMKIIAGRNFSASIASDSMGLVVNEAFVKKMGITKDPINKPVYRNSGGVQEFHIIGVVKDFNFSSLKNSISPLVLFYGANQGVLSVLTQAGQATATLDKLRNKWKSFSPEQEFNFSFMNEDFDATYRNEQRAKQVFVAFSILTIIIACLGLFGLASYNTLKRSREIGIRKVLGSSTGNIVVLLSKDLLMPVLIAACIALPLVKIIMQNWLQGFAYRIAISWWMLLLAAAAALCIAIVTVSVQAVKAAIANPVKSLRTE